MAYEPNIIEKDLQRDCIAHLDVPQSALETPAAYSSQIAYRAALMSWLTYAIFEETDYDPKRDFVPSLSNRGGRRLFVPDFLRERDWEYFTVDTYYVKALGLKLPNAIFVAFRGTKSFFDWMQNAKIKKHYLPREYFRDGQVFLHRGFYQLGRSVFPAVSHKLAKFGDRDVPTFVCGHSLGGALACLFAADRYTPYSYHSASCFDSVYSLAAPRYGGGQLLDYLQRPHHRITMDGDLVPKLPPKRLGFEHDTFALEIKDAQNGGKKPLVRRIRNTLASTAGRITPSGLISAHNIERYIKALEPT